MKMKWCVSISLIIHMIVMIVIPWDLMFERGMAIGQTIEVDLKEAPPEKQKETPDKKIEKVEKKPEEKKRPEDKINLPPQKNEEMEASAEKEEDMMLEAEGKINLSYMNRIKAKISFLWDYPQKAIEYGHAGIVKIFFVVDENGNVIEVGVLGSSGFKELDDAVINAIKKASPFGIITAEYGEPPLRITGRFKYVLD